jgi:hypothetical protein
VGGSHPRTVTRVSSSGASWPIPGFILLFLIHPLVVCLSGAGSGCAAGEGPISSESGGSGPLGVGSCDFRDVVGLMHAPPMPGCSTHRPALL